MEVLLSWRCVSSITLAYLLLGLGSAHPVPTDGTECTGDHPAAVKVDPDYICLCPGVVASRLTLTGSKDVLNSAPGNIKVVGKEKWSHKIS